MAERIVRVDTSRFPTRVFHGAPILMTLVILGTVLLHLYAAALAKRQPPSEPPKPIPAIYIPLPSQFTAMEKFIDETVTTYKLSVFNCTPPSETLPVESVLTPAANSDGEEYISTSEPPPRAVGKSKGGEGMRMALEIYKNKFPHITAILMGTRRTDPHGGKSPEDLCHFHPIMAAR